MNRYLVPLLVLLIGASAKLHAQTFKEPALEALYLAEKVDELRRIATARVAAQADDAQAVLGLALTALERDEAAGRPNAIQRAEACIDRQPKAAPCQYALGLVLGIQAVSEGLFKMARSASTVKEALSQAQALEPDWYRARTALVEFYLLAPGMMGGSAGKAAELASKAPKPEQVKALQARVALAAKQYEPALQALLGLPGGLEPVLAADVLGWSLQGGMAMVNNGQAPKAQPYFERLARERPEQAGPLYGLARARGEQGAHDEALKLYEQALKLQGAAQWPLLYRIGKTQEALGHLDEARSAYQRYVAAGRGPAQLLSEARKRLDQLGA